MPEKRTVWGPPGGVAGVCLKCGNVARSSRAFYCEEHRVDKHGKPVVPLAPKEASPVDLPDTDSAGEAPGSMYGTGERTPTEPKAAKEEKPSLLGRLWGEGKDKAEATITPIKTAERKPAAPKRRSSTADFWGGLVAPAVASGAARAGYVPMARAVAWTSPVVGEIVEDATKGTLVDRAVQPFVRSSEKWENLFDLIGFWGAVGVAQRNPAQAEAALGFARKRFVNLLPMIAKNIKAERAKEKAAADAVIDLMPDIRELFPEMGDSDDPVGLLIQSLFAAPEPPGEPSSNGRHAANVG